MFSDLSVSSEVLLILFVVSVLIYKYFTRNFNYWKERNIPGPTPTAFVGNLGKALTLKSNIGSVFAELYNFADTPVIGFFTFDKPALLLRDPQLIKQILLKDFQSFKDKIMKPANHDQLFANVLFIQPTPEWRRTRQKMTPVFSSSKIKGLFNILQHVCQQMVDDLCTTPVELEAKELGQKFSTELTTQALFGIEGQCFQKEESEVLKHVKNMFKFSVRNALIQTTCFFRSNFLAPLKLTFFQKEIETFFRETFWKCMKIAETSKVKSNNFITLLADLRRNDPTFGK